MLSSFQKISKIAREKAYINSIDEINNKLMKDNTSANNFIFFKSWLKSNYIGAPGWATVLVAPVLNTPGRGVLSRKLFLNILNAILRIFAIFNVCMIRLKSIIISV